MMSSNEHYVLNYNGELYNELEARGYHFMS